ncbi:MAG: adenylate kinase [Omnitrophica bacterium]|nr:adenylate kinase [Candidatus Omnitrophota bacterium]
MNIVLLGPPGAGKGTQAKVLSQEFGVLHVSTGDMLRDAVKRGTSVGKSAKTYMDNGELVPDDLVINMVSERILQKDVKRGFLLDGFPRNKTQALELDDALTRIGKSLDLVLYFKTSPEVSIERLSGRRACTECGANFHIRNMPPRKEGICDHCGGSLVLRNDDTPETVKRRLSVYENETESLIEYYKQKGTLREVSGNLDVKKLFTKIKGLFLEERLL